MADTGLITGSYSDLAARGLTADTLRKFGYQLGTYNGQPCQIAPYCDRDGNVVAQKVRLPGKEFKFIGEPARVFQLFGQNVWGSDGRRVIVAEGEIDAMTISQVRGNKWPVVSIANGASDTKTIERAIGWLEGFEEVVFVYDGDKPGREGALAAAALLSPGKAKIAYLPDGYDPNKLLTSGKTAALEAAIWDAKPYRPDALRSLSDLIKEASKPPEWGAPLPWEPLYDMSYGPKPGQVWIGGAGVGIGKTDVFTEMEAHDLKNGAAIFVYHGEQNPPETVQRIAAKLTGKPYFKPDCEYTEEELSAVMQPYLDRLFVYDHRGSSEWDEIKKHIRWAVKAQGIQRAYVDNLTVLTAEAEDERRFLDGLMKDIKSLAVELGITIHLLSHLTTPDGVAHEEGGKVVAKQFTGSRAIMRYADFMWGLERDTQHEDPAIRSVSTFRVLKDRLTGRSTGQTFHLRYNQETTQQTVCPPPILDAEEKAAESYGFT